MSDSIIELVYEPVRVILILYQGVLSMANNQKAARSAITGQYVTLEYAKKHPKTTIVETVTPAKSSKK